MAFATSVPLARIIGPERLGYYSYIVWLTAMSATLGSLGIPGTAAKFMAEYLGRGEPGIAREIYRRMLRLQMLAALAITTVALLLVWSFGDPHQRVISTFLALAIFPAMLVAVPSQANLANESMRTNIPSSIASTLLYVAAVAVSLILHFDLVGVAIGFLLMKSVDCSIRLLMTNRWIKELPAAQLPSDLVRDMYGFAAQQVYLAVLAMVVWDKSDVVLLKALNSDIRQITFFTLVFNLVDKAVMFPQVFAYSLSTTLMAQYGRDRESVPRMAAISARYTFLFATPMLFGMVLISSPLIRFLYGKKYLEAIPVMAIAAGLAIVRPMLSPADAVFRANNRLGRMLVWTTICAAVNIGIDALLVPHHGAIGAAIGNGTAQALMVIGCWILAAKQFAVKLDWVSMLKILASALAMLPLTLAFNHALPPLFALICDVVAGAIVFLAMLRLLGVLHASDTNRLAHALGTLPASLRLPLGSVLQFVSPAEDDATFAE